MQADFEDGEHVTDSSEQQGPCELNDESLCNKHRRSEMIINPVPEFHFIPNGSEGDPSPNGVVAPPSKDYSRINKDIANKYTNPFVKMSHL